jgi:hypothetical protein
MLLPSLHTFVALRHTAAICPNPLTHSCTADTPWHVTNRPTLQNVIYFFKNIRESNFFADTTFCQKGALAIQLSSNTGNLDLKNIWLPKIWHFMGDICSNKLMKYRQIFRSHTKINMSFATLLLLAGSNFLYSNGSVNIFSRPINSLFISVLL